MKKASKKGLRERKKLKTRDAIIFTAMKMFLEKGFDKVRIEDIAEAIDISPRTFFRYFPNKEKVVFFHHESYVDKLKKAIHSKSKQNLNTYEAVKHGCLELARVYSKSKDEHIKQLKVVQSSPSLVGFANILDTDYEDVIRQKLLEGTDGTPDKERTARIMTHIVMGLIRGVFEEWHMTGCNENLVKIGRKNFSIIDSIIQ